MNIMDMAQKAFALLQEGRDILEQVKSAVADGKTALSSGDLDQLEEQLDREGLETRRAKTSLDEAIAEARNAL